MASSLSIALKKASSSQTLISKLLNSPLRSISVAPSVSRSFNTNAQRSNYDDDVDREVSVDRSTSASPSRRRDPVADVFDPIFGDLRGIGRGVTQMPRNLSQILNLMDQFMEIPYVAASRGLGAGGLRRGWDVTETDDALLLRMDMPGLDKEDVKISVERGTLTVKGEGKDGEDEEDGGRRFSTRLDLPVEVYELNAIKAEMKNGVLKLVAPKVKEEENKNVFEVKIE